MSFQKQKKTVWHFLIVWSAVVIGFCLPAYSATPKTNSIAHRLEKDIDDKREFTLPTDPLPNPINVSALSPYIWNRIDSSSWAFPAYKIIKRSLANDLIIGYWGNGTWDYNINTKLWKRLIPSNINYSMSEWFIEDLKEVFSPNNLAIGVDCDGGFEHNLATNTQKDYKALGICVEKFLDYHGLYFVSMGGAWDVKLSLDKGNSWTYVWHSGTIQPERIWALGADSSGGIYFGGEYGIYKCDTSTFNIDTLLYMPEQAPLGAWDIYFDSNKKALYVASETGLWKSDDYGKNWYRFGLNGIALHCITYNPFDHMLYLGAGKRLSSYADGGVYRGSGDIQLWYNLGLNSFSVQTVCTDNNGGIFAGVANYGVWQMGNTLLGHDTIYIPVHDTIRDTAIKFVLIRDTLIITKIKLVPDTIVKTVTVTVRDTTRDTVYIQLPPIHDSTIITIHQVDTLIQRIVTTVTDTLRDTVIMNTVAYDTIYTDTCWNEQRWKFRIIGCKDTMFVRYAGETKYAIQENPITQNRIPLGIENSGGTKQVVGMILDINGYPVYAFGLSIGLGQQTKFINPIVALPSGVYYIYLLDGDPVLPKQLLRFVVSK